MSKNTKVWNVPEGYELDKEQSTETKVVLKKIEDKRVDSWQEYCELMKDKDSCFVDMNGNIRTTHFLATAAVGEFEDKDDAVAFAALYKLICLRRNWVGNWKPDWTSREPTFIIVNSRDHINDGVSYNVNNPMIFPTEEMRDKFLDTFKDLLEQAKPFL